MFQKLKQRLISLLPVHRQPINYMLNEEACISFIKHLERKFAFYSILEKVVKNNFWLQSKIFYLQTEIEGKREFVKHYQIRYKKCK